MRLLLALAAALALALASPVAARAQCPAPSPNSPWPLQPGGSVFGSNAYQWQAYSQGKVDATNGAACNLAVTGTFTYDGTPFFPVGGVWGPQNGGTGVNNGSYTLSLGGALSIGATTTTGDLLAVTAPGVVGQVSASTAISNLGLAPLGTSGATIGLNNGNNTLSGSVTASGTLNVTGTLELGGQAVGATAVCYPICGGSPTSKVLWADAVNDIYAWALDLISSDASSVGFTVVPSGSTPTSGQTLAFKIAYTGAGSPITITYTETGSEGSSLAAIASAYWLAVWQLTSSGPGQVVNTDWGPGFVGIADLGSGGIGFGTNVPRAFAGSMTIENVSTDTTATMTINGVATTPSSSQPATTELDPGNQYLSLSHTPGAFAWTGGVNSVLFQATDSTGVFSQPFYGTFAVNANNNTGSTQCGVVQIIVIQGTNGPGVFTIGNGCDGGGISDNSYFDSAVGYYGNTTNGSFTGNGQFALSADSNYGYKLGAEGAVGDGALTDHFGNIACYVVAGASGGSPAPKRYCTELQVGNITSAMVKADSSGNLVGATAGSDYLAPPSGTAIQKANSGGALANAVAGTDYEAPALPGTTGSIGGGALLAGACASGTASVTGATTAMGVVATPVTYPGDGNYWLGYVSASGTVTVKVCAAVAGTPTASAYNVRVLQ